MNISNTIELLLAMAPAQPGTQPDPVGQFMQTFGVLAIFLVVMWVIAIRPQQVKAKQHAEMLKTIKPGDKVVTNGGLVAVVISVKDRTVSLRSADSKLELLKSAIADITERAGDGDKSDTATAAK